VRTQLALLAVFVLTCAPACRVQPSPRPMLPDASTVLSTQDASDVRGCEYLGQVRVGDPNRAETGELVGGVRASTLKALLVQLRQEASKLGANTVLWHEATAQLVLPENELRAVVEGEAYVCPDRRLPSKGHAL
jgi:hypothetical protein